ncbi:ferritin-like domain-containing protein [Haloechinothrix halophila]|uniref:ferritin-like domain-containing protein n=1 Tax=Haloechinothrix halophila TaxID=1069073 RepID=UPI000417314E|nr:ferritin-like domain-containing protein [Haloechinothrix halophila]
MRAGARSGITGLSRRDVLRSCVLAAFAVPLSACREGYDDSPDPLSALVAAARTDAESARTITGSGAEIATAVAEVRAAHAHALQREVTRANRPPAASPQLTPVTDLASLGARLRTAAERALTLMRTAPAHRAGLLGSVAAGCASAQALDDALGDVSKPTFDPPKPSGELADDVVGALQQALASEHAALWVYELVTAFLPETFDDSIGAAIDEHRGRKDTATRLISDSGMMPVLAEPAYQPPKPVTDDVSAMAAVVSAEGDAATTWRGVLARTSDATLRSYAADALRASAVHTTHWRAEAGMSPAAVALPGTPA